MHYDWSNALHNKELWIDGGWRDFDIILGNGTLSGIQDLPNEAYQKMICALWSVPNLSNHFREIINPIEGITWCSAGKDVQQLLKETYGIDSFLVSAGVSNTDFYPTRKITTIKNIGLNGTPFVNPEWDKVKRPQMLIDIANRINANPIFIDGKSLDNPHTLYDSIDMYVCASTNDRGPYGIAEAALCKIPVISTKTGFALEIDSIKTFDTVDEAVSIINELNSSPSILSKYIDEVYEEINSKLNWSRIIQEYWIPIFEHHQSLNIKEGIKEHIQLPNIIKNIYYLDLDSKTLRQRNTVSNIPASLHLIWVGEKAPPQRVMENVNTWKALMPHWNITLWTNDNLTEEYFDKEYLDFILSATKAVQQADIMRLYIIEKYGGFYADADIIPARSLDDLLYIDNDIILCNDYPVNLPYISTGFFGAVSGHPVLQAAIKLILDANLNSPEIHVETGPGLFGRCIFMNDWKDKYPAVLNPAAIYTIKNDTIIKFIDVSNKIYNINSFDKKSMNRLEHLNAQYDELLNSIQNGLLIGDNWLLHPLRFGEHMYDKTWDNFSLGHGEKYKYDFIEIGTSDFNTLIEQYPNKKGISIEPISVYFDALPKSDSVIKLNCAITSYDGVITMNWVHPDDIIDNNLPNWIRGCNSIGSHIGRDAFVSDKILRSSDVNCMTWHTLAETYGVNSVDLIKIDTEGHDHIILRQILEDCVVRGIRPNQIIFENNELTNKIEIEKLTNEFKLLGYSYINDYDSILTYQH